MNNIKTLIVAVILGLALTACNGFANGMATGLSNSQLGNNVPTQQQQYGTIQQPTTNYNQTGSYTTFNSNGTTSQGYITTTGGYTNITKLN